MSLRRHALAALLMTVLVTAFQIWRLPPLPIEADALGYSIIAHDLTRFEAFTDGALGKRGVPPPPGMFVPPLYPGFVAAMMALDPALERTIDCNVQDWAQGVYGRCVTDLGIALPIQGALAVLCAFLVWVAGWRLTGSVICAWGALALALVTGRYASYAGQVLTENLALPLFTAATLGLIEAVRSRSPWHMAGTGLLFGLLVLVRPGFAYVFYLALPLAAWALRSMGWRRVGGHVALLAAGYVLAVGPWILRNALVLDTAAVTASYDAFILAQRLAYNAMSMREWLVSFVYWLPGPGEHLVEATLPAAEWQRLTFTHPDSFFAIGNGAWRTQLFEQAGGIQQATGLLLRQELLPNLPKHLLVTLALAWRGVWIVKYWAFLTVPASLVAAWLAARRGNLALLAFMAPAWFMLGFHAFASVNVHRYNLILIPSLSVATAWLVWRLGVELRGRRVARP